jgi:hypothetical protein
MQILRTIGGLVSLGLAVLFSAPLAVTAWAAFDPHHNDIIISLSAGGHEFTGLKMWAIVIAFTFVGIAFAAIGFYALKSSKSDA